jgi:hypothetical protein
MWKKIVLSQLEAHVLFRHLSGGSEEDSESTVQKLHQFSEIACETSRKKTCESVSIFRNRQEFKMVVSLFYSFICLFLV